MIHPSRRQRTSRPTVEQTFALHVRIAARNAWSVRLLRGSAAALLASLVSAAAGAVPWLQGAVLLGAFFVGAVLPVGDHRVRALRYIRERAGLSYETALEIDAGSEGATFAEAVRARAVDSVRDVRPPDLPAWWLPLLAAALALLLFPLASRPVPLTGASGNPTQEAPPQAGAPERPTPSSAPPPPPSAPQRAQAADNGSSSSNASDASAAAGSGGRASDQQVLSNYLQTLQPSTPTGAAPSGPAGPATDGAPSDGSAAPGTPTSGASRSGTAGSNATGSGAAGGTGTASSGVPSQGAAPGRDTSGAASGSNGSGAGASQAPAGASPPEGAASPAPPTGSGPPPSGANGASDGQGRQPDGGAGSGPSSQQGAAQGSQAEGGGASGTSAGQPQPGPADGGTLPGAQNGEGSGTGGNQPGTAGPSGPAAQGAGQAPQFLPGELRPGEQSASGSLRLPGSTDVTLPPGTSMESYRRAAEQALTEGDVPLEYQEVIRRYFR